LHVDNANKKTAKLMDISDTVNGIITVKCLNMRPPPTPKKVKKQIPFLTFEYFYSV